MAMQIRRGKRADFDPWKMKDGELALSTDTTAGDQWVWATFAPGVVKRIATYEDFSAWLDGFKDDTTKELKQVLDLYITQLKNGADQWIQLKIDGEWIPLLQRYVDQAGISANAAKTSETNAAKSESAAKTSENNALNAESGAKTSQEAAKASENNAKTSETNSENWAKLAESHAHGSTGARAGEATDNSKYWSEQAHSFADEVQAKANWRWCGDYVAGTSYQVNNLVEYNGSVWIALIDSPQGIPQEDHTNWDLFAYGYPPQGTNDETGYETVLIQTEWTQSNDYLIYRIPVTGLKSLDRVDVYSGDDLSDEEVRSYAKLDLRSVIVEDEGFVLKAKGTILSDLPVRYIVKKK